MTVTNDFLAFASNDTGSNLEAQSTYVTDPNRLIGNVPGVASSKFVNKVLRQTSYMTSQIAQFIANQLNQNVLDNAAPATLLAQIMLAFQSPVGTVAMFAGIAGSVPTGWLICDGSAVSRTTYANLFALIGSTYGAGDGSTTFNLPNAKGVFVRGVGTQTIGGLTYTGALGTSQIHSTALPTTTAFSTNSAGSHFHNVWGTNAGGSYGATGPGAVQAYGLAAVYNPQGGTYAYNAADTGGGGAQYLQTNGAHAHSIASGGDAETRPANLGLNYMIKY